MHPDPSDPPKPDATCGDAYMFANAKIVNRACHAWLLANDPNYPAECAANKARAERAMANRERKTKS